MEGDQERKRKSIGFSLSVADEKIKLIDILSDDDNDNDFLVASHLSNSLQAIRENAEKDRKGQLWLPPLCVESSRPSLAWDSAFFNSSGFLDQHELSIVNQGFKTQESTSNKLKKVDCCSGSNKKSSRKEASVFSPNPAKVICRLKNSLMKPNKKDLVGKQYHSKMEKTHTTVPNSARFSHSSPGSCPSHLTRMAQSRKSEMSNIWRCSGRTKLVPNPSPLSTGLHSKTRYDKAPIIMDSNDAKEAPNSLQEARDIFFSAAQFKPSGIRPPSPKIGFFDEKTPPFSLGEPKTRRNTPLKVESQRTPLDSKARYFPCSNTDTLADAACEKLKRNMKRLKAAHTNPPNSIKKRSENASRKLSKYDPFSSQENGKKKKKKKKVCADSGDQHGKLCSYFEAIDLKQDKQQPFSPSSNKTRTPLAEKALSIYDYSNTNLIWFGTK